MALPMLKESPPMQAREVPPVRNRMPPPTPEMLARARELERELGHPLRDEIDGPLNDQQLEEVLLARLISEEELIPAEEVLKEFGRL